jgi:Mrp family chromosome partitioning ATPase
VGWQQEQVQTQAFVAPQTDAQTDWTPPLNGKSMALETDALVRDEISKLVQRLFLLPNGSRVVTFAGVEEGNGCTWLTARAGDLLASQIAGTVCVVDGNFRSPNLHDCWHVENVRGLTDAMTERGPIGKYCRPLDRENLWLMSGGSMAANGRSWMGSEVLRSRVADLRATFDFVLIDAPAVAQGGDAIVWGHLADGVVMVLGANDTHRETAHWAATKLASANVRVLGGVLNKRTFPIPGSVYSKLKL